MGGGRELRTVTAEIVLLRPRAPSFFQTTRSLRTQLQVCAVADRVASKVSYFLELFTID
jgi:hypothetical protein